MFDLSKPVAIGADHAGFAYKQQLIAFLREKGLEVNDFGTHGTDSVDYPDFAHPVASAVESGAAGLGILVALPVAFGLARLLRSQIFGVSPADPLTLVAAILVIAATALVAALVPARRAAAVDPTTALRTE